MFQAINLKSSKFHNEKAIAYPGASHPYNLGAPAVTVGFSGICNNETQAAYCQDCEGKASFFYRNSKYGCKSWLVHFLDTASQPIYVS